MATQLQLVEEPFVERLRYLQAGLAVMLQSSEYADLLNSGYYSKTLLQTALEAISEATKAWENY